MLLNYVEKLDYQNNIKNEIWSISFIKFIMIESQVHNLANILVLKEKRKTIL